jgi:hypothetical protein
VVSLGCSEDIKVNKALNEQVKQKTQNNNRFEEFPLTCNIGIVSGLSILLSLTLMFHIFIHIPLFIFL